MKYSGLYFINNPSTNLDASLNLVTTLVQSIDTTWPNALRQSPWSLQYRLFRDTIPPRNAPATDAEGKTVPYAHTLQHILHNSSLDKDRTYICIQPPNGAPTVNTIPLRQQEPHALLLRHQFSALWQPRHVLQLPQGVFYKAGLCDILLGELRSSREGPQSAGVQSPGVLVCITTTIGADDLEDWQKKGKSVPEEEEEEPDFDWAQAVIRDCWNKIKSGQNLGKSEVKEVMMDTNTVNKHENETAARMWCEAIRLRG
ncbi:hypothetical protein BDU57DRAFT_555247 [Ampelomyces quisqualis]|uniref:Mediator of RNA polymerase II transcription subunit 20 n=1 Tax=Ampelomyces quisqualis TaxID=50730 RepID=A0A6A5QS30_AMPQU|nr:hypothetical protein BDU57DRAFT_555247 [Ampelomyces quisqualis]